MGLEVLLAYVASLLATGTVALFRELLSLKGVDVDRAIRSTRDHFPLIPGVEPALEKWIEGSEFEELFRDAQTGERDFDAEEVISSFISDGDFHMPSEAESRELAEDVVRAFLRAMIVELYLSDAGVVVLADRQEELARHAK